MTKQIAIRLTDQDAQALDELVRSGRYPDRTAALRAALHALVRDEFDRQLVEEFEQAYARQPASSDDRALLEAGALAMQELIEAEEPRR